MIPANDNRPTGFDAALVAYLPMLRRKARIITRDRQKADDLLQESMIAMLRRAGTCRMETFRTWAQLVMESVASGMRKHERRQMRNAPEVSIDAMVGDDVAPLENRCAQLRVQPEQFVRADLAEVVDRLQRIPNGNIVLRRAAGELLSDIGDENGTSKENVRQKEERARAVLVAHLQRRAA